MNRLSSASSICVASGTLETRPGPGPRHVLHTVPSPLPLQNDLCRGWGMVGKGGRGVEGEEGMLLFSCRAFLNSAFLPLSGFVF